MSSPSAIGDEKSSDSKGKDHTKVTDGEMVSSMTTNLNGDIKVQKKMETTIGESSSGTNATDNTASKKEKREKMKNNNSDLGDILSTPESTQKGLGMTQVLGVKSNETDSGKVATPDTNMVSKEHDHTVVADGKPRESETTNLSVNGKGKKKKKQKSKNKPLTLGEILSPQCLQNLEAANGETGSGTTSTDNPATEKQRRQKLHNNPDLDDILTIRESTQEGLSTTKVLEVKSGETVYGKTETPHANIMSKGDHIEVVNGKMEESETKNPNVNGKERRKKKRKQKDKRPTLYEILNPQYLQNLEAAKGETGSVTTSTCNSSSKKRKRQKMKNDNTDLGDVLSTHESTQEGISTNNVLEVKSGETVYGRTATPDANILSKGDHIEVANGKLVDNETTNFNVNGKKKKKKKPKSKNKRPTLGEILNPQYLQNLEAANGETGLGINSTDDLASERQKRQKLNKNPDLGDILSTHESSDKGLSTTKFLEVKSGETVSAKAGTPDANMVPKDHIEVANGRMEESETSNPIVNVKERRKKKRKPKNKLPSLDEILNPQHLQNLEAAKGEMGSSTTSTGTPTSKRRKKEKMKNNNPGLADFLSTCESTQEELSSKGDHTEVSNGETVYGTSATHDATMVSKDHTEVSNGKMGESETTNLNVNCKEKKTKKPKSKNKRTTSGEMTEILKPQYFDLLDASNASISSKLTEKSKSLDTMIMNKGSGNGATLGKKLLVLDVNGLLADIVLCRSRHIKADKHIGKRGIFKRPYLDDFLNFCFERFSVGIWSSRPMTNLVPVVDFLLGDSREKLLFLWDGSNCIHSGMGTREVKYKRVIAKELRKIWDNDGPGNSWVKGTFNESNTLLVDDSPYKALLNPKHTGIFPASYSYKNRNDNFLGPKGKLQTYLEGWADADDVKTYVEQHPFGQRCHR